MIINQVYPIQNKQLQPDQRLNFLVLQLGRNVKMPDYTRNYCNFNYPLVNEIVSYREKAVPAVESFLKAVLDERQISEGLYVLDRMIDAGVKGIEKTYPTISRFNNTNSPTIQVMLSGIYRKTKPPEAFGPLVGMLVRGSLSPQNPYFDPSEEIGGAVLEYLRDKNAVKLYS